MTTTYSSHRPAPDDADERPTNPAHRPTVFAGWWMVGVALLHTVAFVFHEYWADWLSGDLWSGDAPMESIALFWALPGSFVVLLAVLGLLVVRMGRRDEAVPGYVGWSVGLWCLMCIGLIGPSGFLTGLVPSAVLIVSGIRRSRRARATA